MNTDQNIKVSQSRVHKIYSSQNLIFGMKVCFADPCKMNLTQRCHSIIGANHKRSYEIFTPVINRSSRQELFHKKGVLQNSHEMPVPKSLF